MKRSIFCVIDLWIFVSQNLLVSAVAIEPYNASTNIDSEPAIDLVVPENVINPGDQASVYLNASNKTLVQLLSFRNLDGKTTLRANFDETTGPTEVYVEIQQKKPGSDDFEVVSDAAKTLSLGDSIRAGNISSDLNTEIKVMARWVKGASGRATFSFYLT